MQNLIVDVLDHYYYKRKGRYDEMATASYFHRPAALSGTSFTLQRVTVGRTSRTGSISRMFGALPAAGRPIYFPASYRTQRN